MKKTLLGLLSLFSIGLVIGVIMLGRSFMAIKEIESALPKIGVGEPVFHPDSVLEFGWNALGERSYFTREERGAHWYPQTEYQAIQKRLNFLSRMNAETIPPLKNSLVTITLKFDTQKEWSGIFDGNSFRWSKGPLKGRGGRLYQVDLYLFAAGRYALNLNKVSWCNSRIKKITGNDSLENTDGKWLKAGKAIEGSKMEVWMGRNCRTPIDAMIDTELLNPTSFESKFQVEFADNSKKILEWNHHGLIKISEKKKSQLFFSKQFLDQLKKLDLAPIKGN